MHEHISRMRKLHKSRRWARRVTELAALQADRRELRLSLLRDDPHCHYCRSPLNESNSSLDHRIPRAQGGDDRPRNILLSCKPCNTEKGSLSYEAFLEKRRRWQEGFRPARRLRWLEPFMPRAVPKPDPGEEADIRGLEPVNYFNEDLVRVIAYYIWEKSVADGVEKSAFDCWVMAVGYYSDMDVFRRFEP